MLASSSDRSRDRGIGGLGLKKKSILNRQPINVKHFLPYQYILSKREMLFRSLEDTTSYCSDNKMHKEYLLYKYIVIYTTIIPS